MVHHWLDDCSETLEVTEYFWRQVEFDLRSDYLLTVITLCIESGDSDTARALARELVSEARKLTD